MLSRVKRFFTRRELTLQEKIEKRDSYQEKIDKLNKDIGLPWSRISADNRYIKVSKEVH